MVLGLCLWVGIAGRDCGGHGDGGGAAGVGTRLADDGREVDWLRMSVMRGGKVSMDFYVGRRDGKMAIGVRGRF